MLSGALTHEFSTKPKLLVLTYALGELQIISSLISTAPNLSLDYYTIIAESGTTLYKFRNLHIYFSHVGYPGLLFSDFLILHNGLYKIFIWSHSIIFFTWVHIGIFSWCVTSIFNCGKVY